MFQIDIEECSLYIFCAEIISYLGKSAEGYKEKKSHVLTLDLEIL